MKNKKFFIGLALTIILLVATAIPALAGGDPEDWAEYCTQPGCDVSASHTICQGHGSFGAFGKGWNLGNDVSGHYREGGLGANGQATGYNNSHLCGNPQN